MFPPSINQAYDAKKIAARTKNPKKLKQRPTKNVYKNVYNCCPMLWITQGYQQSYPQAVLCISELILWTNPILSNKKTVFKCFFGHLSTKRRAIFSTW
jgi:hypothetical protein